MGAIAMVKHHDQKQVGEERVYASTSTVHHLKKSGKEFKQDRNQEAGADAGAMEGAAYQLAPMACSACFLIEPNPGMAPIDSCV